MKILGSAAPLVEAPTTATVFGSNSGRNRSITLSLLSRVVRGSWIVDGATRVSMNRASTATAPCSETINGLMSASAMSGACVISKPPSPPTLSSASTMASREAGLRPRVPRSSAAPLSSSSISPASTRVIGQMRNETSASTSTKTPPSPTITSGPNCGSFRPPITTSCPAGAISSSRKPSMRALSIAGSFIIARTDSSTSPAFLSPTLTPPASLLCRMSGETTFSAKGALSFSQAAAASAAPWINRDFGTVRPKPARSALPASSSSAARRAARARAMSSAPALTRPPPLLMRPASARGLRR